ncbi:site-specific integrase [Brevundimonas sp. NIBR11]|uniref:tyrosine-type recombinase/integrase n=1 Tax=Brevundimonas sp. NIBR11 TaxID=3015999 RepID=UPI0022F10F89|nr:site-specific integrase [Brevundimonas sp. NIBR11]WGM31534.1 Prophage integrase IntA [Brevundimonas sp. NIBR11]
MARAINRLTTLGVKALREPGMHADGQGLYLRIDQTGARRWVLIYHHGGRRREMGLGSIEKVKLADARDAAEAARRQIKDGLDPITARKANSLAPADRKFSAVASALMDDLEKGWKSKKSRPQWEASLSQHCPAIWSSDVAEVDTEMVLNALRPIWTALPETAGRVRSRLERVLDAAKVRGLREGENPARWRGHLSSLLTGAKRAKSHHAALPYGEVPDLMKLLATRQSVSAAALRFLILTAARSGEVRGAAPGEIHGGLWVVPASRMKAGKEHRVPLTDDALAAIAAVPAIGQQSYLFPGMNGQLSDATIGKVLKVNGIQNATPHGFRSAFRDWAGDCTGYPRELIEEALAHQVGNAVERAYRRSDALEKRRALMIAWADFCMGRSGQVIPFASRPTG